MRFKIFIIILSFNLALVSSEDFKHHFSTVNLDQQLVDHAKLRDDRCKFILLEAVKALDDSNLDRKQFKNVRDNLNKFCEDAKEAEDVSQMLINIQENHRYCQYVSARWLKNERIALKKVLNQRIDAENLKNNDTISQPTGSATAPAIALLVGDNYNK